MISSLSLSSHRNRLTNFFLLDPFAGSHVTQSLTKLLSRVVAPDEVDYENMTYKKKAATSKLHKFTFGITSDPITQFACAFSALIHGEYSGEMTICQCYRSLIPFLFFR
jgi:hypothetical protein